MASNNLRDEFDFFINNQASIVESYNGKYVVIKNREILGAYESEHEAIEKTTQTHSLGTFLVQLATPGNTAYTQTFHSRVGF